MNIKNQSTESSDSFRNRVAVTNCSRPMSERWQNEHKNQIIEISYSSQTHWLYQIALHQCLTVCVLKVLIALQTILLCQAVQDTNSSNIK